MCIQRVFCRKFNFGQLLFKAFFDIIKSFGRNRVKFSKNFDNPYFRENSYSNPYAFEKSIYVRIHLYVCQHWVLRQTFVGFDVWKIPTFFWNDDYRAKLAQLKTSAPLHTICHLPNIYQMPHLCSHLYALKCMKQIHTCGPQTNSFA